MAISKYETNVKDKLFLVECWARDGLTEEQISNNLGISYSSFRDYKNKHSALLTALKKGKEIVDYEVENALFKKAISGDTTAQIFWLKNRKPHVWRDRKDIDADIKTDQKIIDVSKLTTEQIKELLSKDE